MPTFDFSAAFQAFATWQFLALCLLVFGITYIIRTAVEALWVGAEANRIWSKLFVPIGPLVNGWLLGYVSFLPWPEIAGKTTGSHCTVGFIAGLMAAHSYGRFKDWIKNDLPQPPPAAKG